MGLILGEMEATRTGSLRMTKRDKLWVEAREFKQSFYVLASPTETEDQIRSTVGVPQTATLYEGAVCLGHELRELHSVLHPRTKAPGILVEVVGHFSNDINPDDADEANTPPENRRAVVNWSAELEEELLERDAITGAAIETTAHEPLLIVTPKLIHILEVIRYEAWPFNPLVNFVYGGKLNGSPFYGAPEGTAWLQPIEAPEETLEGTRYVHATYRTKFKIELDPDTGDFMSDTWLVRLLNQGQQYLDPNDDDKIKRATDEEGNPIKVNLHESGRKLVEGFEDPHYLAFNRVGKQDLNDLNLGPFA